jgi:hypothetical protein
MHVLIAGERDAHEGHLDRDDFAAAPPAGLDGERATEGSPPRKRRAGGRRRCSMAPPCRAPEKRKRGPDRQGSRSFGSDPRPAWVSLHRRVDQWRARARATAT